MNPRRPSKGSKEFIGRWRIEEMDLWDRDALDLVAPAFIEFRSDDTGDLVSSPSGVGWIVGRRQSTMGRARVFVGW